jgi:two-component system, OmpR family, response regulator
MTILIIEDNQKLSANIKVVLEKEKYIVKQAASLKETLPLLEKHQFDLIILDLGLPDGDGQDLCQKIREMGLTCPILILTARIDLDSKVEGLDGGADDYLTKPFLMDELLARIRSLLRRSQQQATQLNSAVIQLKPDLCLDTSTHQLLNSDQEINLTPTEYRLIEYLSHHLNQVVTPVELYQHVWGDFADKLAFSDTLKVHISRLRSKIGSEVIETVTGRGYLIKAKDETNSN